jgi:hypothetical protein
MSIPRRWLGAATAARLALVAFVLLAAPFLAAGVPAAPSDGGWPRAITVEGVRVVMYQPQPDGREDTILTGRAAVAITPKGEKEPTFGTVWLRARMEIDREKREVRFAEITVPRVRFPGSKPEQETRLVALLEKEIPKWDLVIALDRLIASLQAVERTKASEEKFSTKPPAIVVRDEPTFLLMLDGEPVLRPVEGTNVVRVVNTPYFVASDGKNYWLPGGSIWFKTDDLLKGKWSPAWKPSKEVASYYARSQSSTIQPVPGKKDSNAKEPDILVATVPTELVVTEGEPKLVPIEDSDLQYVGNTKSHLFMSVADQRWYVLLSGRWFRAAGLDGPWEFVRSDALPEAFAKIPESSPKAEVLASVAGTKQAQEALIDAQVPQTSAIKRTAAAPKVTYDGEPKFEPIEGTSIAYATNTASQVMLIGGQYFVCDQGVWFVGGAPQGPFVVADTVPAEIQMIPPDHPGYNTKYVYVYDSTEEVVYVGYTSAYLGSYPWYGTVVWGTGWYYPPYVSPHFYYPHPVTYGFAVGYNPYGGWSVGVGVGFTYGAFTFGFVIGGAYGGYWGPYYRPPMYYPGYPGWGGGYPGYGPGRPVNPGGPRPTPYGTNGNLYARDANRTRNAASTRPSGGAAPSTLASSPNNLYSDRDGNVARRGADGSWQSRDGGSWQGTSGGSSLERDYQARQRGSQMMQHGGYGGARMSGGGGRRR